jgi:predicted ribosomally synthesized peptide with SipW-like signal peptide
VLLSLALVAVLVVGGTNAAFSDTTENASNSLSAGTVDLVDDDSGSAMFSVSNMLPGQIVTKCIVVTYQGTVTNPSAVKLYSGGFIDSGSLGTYLKLTVEEGTGGTFSSCTGFTTGTTIISDLALATFNTTYTNYLNGAGSWDPATTPESKTFRLTVQMDSATPNSQQGKSVTGLTFTWEVQS